MRIRMDEENKQGGLILSSNENWNKVIFHDLSLVFDDKPILVSTDVLASTLDLGISKLSLKLLDHKYGNFFYKPEIGVLAASLGFSFESGAEFDSNIGIHIRSWCLKGKKWFALKRSPVIHSFVNGQSENYRAASNYARSAILKLSKAGSLEEFNSMMLDIRRNCRKWCDK